MTREEFTAKSATLIIHAIARGHRPIIDYVKRSDEEQKHMFDMGLSKCDGIVKKSAHQSGAAMDLYFLKDNNDVDWNDDMKLNEQYHLIWVQMGGKVMIPWDRGHYE